MNPIKLSLLVVTFVASVVVDVKAIDKNSDDELKNLAGVELEDLKLEHKAHRMFPYLL